MDSFTEELKKNETLLSELNEKNKEISVSVFLIIFNVVLVYFFSHLLKFNF